MINKGILKVDFIFTFFKPMPLKEEKVTYEEKNSIENISEINGNDNFLYKSKKSKDIRFPVKKNRLIFEERRHLKLVKEEKNFFVATENLLTNEETSREESNTDIHREPVIIVSF